MITQIKITIFCMVIFDSKMILIWYNISMFKKYVHYLQNNPQHFWFKRKIWGWGWIPATWEGVLTTLVYIVLVSFLVFHREESIPGSPDSGSNFLVLGLPIILLTILFIFIAYKKGEKPKWQWGLDQKEK